MERKSGFKECPRCGLRNKPSAAQCDFCGWEFRDVSDEWISHVQVLEKLNRATESIVLDDEVSRRIESTIVRAGRDPVPPKQVQAPEVQPSPVPAAEKDIVIEDEPQVLVRKRTERRVVVVQPHLPEEEKEVKNFVETMIGEPVTPQAAAVVNVQANEAIIHPGVLATPAAEAPIGACLPRQSFLSHYHRFMLMAGAGVYAVTLPLYSLSYLSTTLGWGLSATGALLITLGIGHIHDARMARATPGDQLIGRSIRPRDEVVICPRCHEEVRERDSRCPSCGAAFSR